MYKTTLYTFIGVSILLLSEARSLQKARENIYSNNNRSIQLLDSLIRSNIVADPNESKHNVMKKNKLENSTFNPFNAAQPMENNHHSFQYPDLSDECFRRYQNCTIINAQPYERRSNTLLDDCKYYCSTSESESFRCLSFVYDYANKICDLFAHVGDQYPARILKFHTREYFESTFSKLCSTRYKLSADIDSNAVPVQSDQSQLDGLRSLEEKNSTDWNDDPNCEHGKGLKYLETKGFQLFGYDHLVLRSIKSVDDCLTACNNNYEMKNGRISCHSVDYHQNWCVLSIESAVPLGLGKLQSSPNSDYFEKICIKQHLLSKCDGTIKRYPQMIIIGFAEAVLDANNIEECIENCLDSLNLHGINCTSGLYYFQETKSNCILNRENRLTQEKLFATETDDLVDYFEVQNCHRGSIMNPRTDSKILVPIYHKPFGVQREPELPAEMLRF